MARGALSAYAAVPAGNGTVRLIGCGELCPMPAGCATRPDVSPLAELQYACKAARFSGR